jgi:hypothetical protein
MICHLELIVMPILILGLYFPFNVNDQHSTLHSVFFLLKIYQLNLHFFHRQLTIVLSTCQYVGI